MYADRQLAGQHRILREALEVPARRVGGGAGSQLARGGPGAFLARLPGHDRARLFDQSGSQVAPSEVPEGIHTDGVMLTWPAVSPRAPLGPSVVLTDGMPSRGQLAVRQVSIPTVKAAFSSRLSAPVSAAISREKLTLTRDQVLA